VSRILITGGAGFIGSHLVDRLIREEDDVVVLDNLTTGKKEYIQHNFNNPKFHFHQVDLLSDNIDRYFKDIDEVWHLAANSDTRAALKDTKVDIDQNILATYKVLEAMRRNNTKRIIFTSSSTVYGEAKQIPTPEDYPCKPISLYGASKLACEGLISAYVHTFGFYAVIFRLANVVGPRISRGVIYDFVEKLKRKPDKLEILGNGNQKKSYLYITDCVDGMIFASRKIGSFEILNLGSEDWISVKEIARIVCEELSLTPRLEFGSSDRGWEGDVPLMLLDISKVKRLGWKPKYDSQSAVKLTVRSLVNASAPPPRR
jgi:UDP-glucose 4-epimerase